MMKAQRKKNQHYVFRAHLKQWAHKEQIWCLRRGEIFRSNLTRVAAERFFYQTYPLTDEEKEFVVKVMIEVNGTPEPLKELLHRFLYIYCLGHSVKEKLKFHAKAFEQKHGLEMLVEQEQMLDRLIETGAEDWIAGVENDFLPFLKLMLQGKTEFYGNYKFAMAFIFGLCVQFTRTKRVRETSLRVMGQDIQGRSTLHMMSVVAHLMAIRTSYYLFSERNSYKVAIVENKSDTPFITTDQPVINLHGDVKADGIPPERFELFYPLSPTRAMVFLEKNTPFELGISSIRANNYNVIMAQHSHEQIFSNSKEYIESFAKIIAGVGSGNRLRTW